MDMKWRLFGRILRLNEEALANQAMSAYFQTDRLSGYSGRPGTLEIDVQQINLRLENTLLIIVNVPVPKLQVN